MVHQAGTHGRRHTAMRPFGPHYRMVMAPTPVSTLSSTLLDAMA